MSTRLFPKRTITPIFLVLTGFLMSSLPAYGFLWSNRWEPIADEEFTLGAPRIDPEASAEYLERSYTYDDTDLGRTGTRIDSYHRIKVFNQKGVDSLVKIDIVYKEDTRIDNFGARITFPDGTSTELDRKDLYDRDLVKSEGVTLKTKSFSFPRIEPGCIVEYKWTERRNTPNWGFPVYLPGDFPTHRYFIEVLPFPQAHSMISLHNGATNMKKTGRRTFVLEMTDLPASDEEPYAPPRTERDPWIYFRYLKDVTISVDRYWKDMARYLWINQSDHLKPKGRTVKRKAEELFAGLNDGEEIIRKAYEFCSREIVNLSAACKYTEGEIDKLKKNEHPADTLQHGYGQPYDINMLFASLLASQGMDVRLALVEDRDDLRYSPEITGPMNLSDYLVVIRKGDTWWPCSPGSPYLPYGWIDSRNSGAVMLVADRQSPILQRTDRKEHHESLVLREAQLKLASSGDLNGRVTITFRGYPSIWRKRIYDTLTEKAANEQFFAELKEQMPRAEFSGFNMKNTLSHDDDLVAEFEVSIPSYAEAVGSRLFFEPTFFEYGKASSFPAETRKNNIRFSFPFSQKDTVWFALPEGYELEEAAAPGLPIQTGAIDYNQTLGTNQAKTRLRATRQLDIIREEYPKGIYTEIKTLFDEISRQDKHSIALKHNGS